MFSIGEESTVQTHRDMLFQPAHHSFSQLGHARIVHDPVMLNCSATNHSLQIYITLTFYLLRTMTCSNWKAMNADPSIDFFCFLIFFGGRGMLAISRQ